MYSVICNYCGEEFIFSLMDQKPDICSNCNSSLQNMTVETASTVESENARINSCNSPPTIILIYQKTGEEIHIPPKDKIIIGRESFGHEVLSKIEYVSRIHCVLECINNQYMITDLNSRNGTFVGISKIDCKLNPKQILKDGELLFLGQEPFLVKLEEGSEFISSETKETKGSELVLNYNQNKNNFNTIKYRCKSCGAESDIMEDICKTCNAYGMMEILQN